MAVTDRHNEIYAEISSVLQAELACAESLYATSSEIKSLMESSRFDMVKERYFSRGEVLNLMAELDGKLVSLLNLGRNLIEDEEWYDLISIGKSLHDLMCSIMKLDTANSRNIQINCDDISMKLNRLQQGKQIVGTYTRCDMDRHNSYQA